MDIQSHSPSPADALQRIAGRVRRTPVLTNSLLDNSVGGSLLFKCENLQHTGSFKFRGATFAVDQLPDSVRAVATHSSGNHGAALAAAARERGIAATVVMPENAVGIKVQAIRAFGGTVNFCAPTQSAREAGLDELIQRGQVAIPPYDHTDIIAGQGTLALELLAQAPELDTIVAPIGGGGLLAGITLAVQRHAPHIEVIGAEPAAADDAQRSLAAGARVKDHQPQTIADGLRALIGVRNFDILSANQTEILTVSDEQIINAMMMLWRYLKQTIEPSAAVPLAAILKHPKRFSSRRVGVILSGGNVDTDLVLKAFEGVK